MNGEGILCQASPGLHHPADDGCHSQAGKVARSVVAAVVLLAAAVGCSSRTGSDQDAKRPLDLASVPAGGFVKPADGEERMRVVLLSAADLSCDELAAEFRSALESAANRVYPDMAEYYFGSGVLGPLSPLDQAFPETALYMGIASTIALVDETSGRAACGGVGFFEDLAPLVTAELIRGLSSAIEGTQEERTVQGWLLIYELTQSLYRQEA